MGVCVDMCVDTCVDMYVDMCVGMCVDMWLGMHVVSLVLKQLRTHVFRYICSLVGADRRGPYS